METKIKSLYLRLLNKDCKNVRRVYTLEREALNKMFIHRRTIKLTTRERNLSSSKAYKEEEAIYKFIVRHSVNE